MNQEKIGKLIATLRKKLNLTQSELGAKVGVGDRAVSKWERGITCPDISIINDLSKVLGITSDELLKGELNREHRKSHFNKKLLFLLPILLIITIIAVYIYNNRSCIYTLKSTNSDYNVIGTIAFENNQTTIIINNLSFRQKEYDNLYIKNYEYTIRSNNDFIIRNGYIDEDELLFKPILVNDFIKSFNINYHVDDQVSKETIINNGLIFEITFLGDNDSRYKNTIKLVLEKSK